VSERTVDDVTVVEAALTHQRFRFDLFPQQAVFGQSVARFERNGVDRSFVDLMFDGFVQHEKSRGYSPLHVPVHAQRQPVGQQLLNDELSPAQ
jgi:hypothetical protein